MTGHFFPLSPPQCPSSPCWVSVSPATTQIVGTLPKALCYASWEEFQRMSSKNGAKSSLSQFQREKEPKVLTPFWGVGGGSETHLSWFPELSFSGSSDQQWFMDAKKLFVRSGSCYILAEVSSHSEDWSHLWLITPRVPWGVNNSLLKCHRKVSLHLLPTV